MEHALRYGQNPHQKGFVTVDSESPDPLGLAHYVTPEGEPISSQFSQMSWGSLNDLNRGVESFVRIAAAFDQNFGSVPMIAIILQHGTTSGAAFGSTDQVIEAAIQSNYRASFGSFLITNVEITDSVALHIRQWMPASRPFSGFAAPLIVPRTRDFFARKSKSCNMYVNPALSKVDASSLQHGVQQRSLRGASLRQEPYEFVPKFPSDWDEDLRRDMCMAWGVAAASNSTAVSIVKGGRLLSNASGGQERARACEDAIAQAQRNQRAVSLEGAAVASDGYFSFADGIDALARKKVRAIFATDGSIHDEEVRKHAEKYDGLIFHTVPDEMGRSFFWG